MEFSKKRQNPSQLNNHIISFSNTFKDPLIHKVKVPQKIP